MSSQAWIATVTIEPSQNDLDIMRRWLQENAPPVPSRNADVLAKFTRVILTMNAESEWIDCRFSVERPKPMITRPWANDQEWDDWSNAEGPTGPRSRLALAVDGFAALMVLACIALIATHAFTPSQHPSVPWYNASHATLADVSPTLPN